MTSLQRLLPIAVLFPTILFGGTLGYRVLEGWPLIDCFYMAVITISTVGFAEVHPLSTMGQLFTGILIILGVGSITYALTALTNLLVATEIQGFLRNRKMERLIASLDEHYVVCGYGEVGRQVCRELASKKIDLVVIDLNPDAVERAHEDGFLAILGDAGLDTVLEKCGVERAVGLVAATDDDASNLLVVLSARGLRKDLRIVARANIGEVVGKLKRAGADRVLFPESIAGRRLAQMLLNPEIADFLDIVVHGESMELLLEKFRIPPHSSLHGKTLQESRIREETGVSIIGVKRSEEGVLPAVADDLQLRSGDTIFALGTKDQIELLSSRLHLHPETDPEEN